MPLPCHAKLQCPRCDVLSQISLDLHHLQNLQKVKALRQAVSQSMSLVLQIRSAAVACPN